MKSSACATSTGSSIPPKLRRRSTPRAPPRALLRGKAPPKARANDQGGRSAHRFREGAGYRRNLSDVAAARGGDGGAAAGADRNSRIGGFRAAAYADRTRVV